MPALNLTFYTDTTFFKTMWVTARDILRGQRYNHGALSRDTGVHFSTLKLLKDGERTPSIRTLLLVLEWVRQPREMKGYDWEAAITPAMRAEATQSLVTRFAVMIPRVPTSLREAEETGSLLYFSGAACRHGHTTVRYTTSRRCVICVHSEYKDTRVHGSKRKKEKQE